MDSEKFYRSRCMCDVWSTGDRINIVDDPRSN